MSSFLLYFFIGIFSPIIDNILLFDLLIYELSELIFFLNLMLIDIVPPVDFLEVSL